MALINPATTLKKKYSRTGTGYVPGQTQDITRMMQTNMIIGTMLDIAQASESLMQSVLTMIGDQTSIIAGQTSLMRRQHEVFQELAATMKDQQSDAAIERVKTSPRPAASGQISHQTEGPSGSWLGRLGSSGGAAGIALLLYLAYEFVLGFVRDFHKGGTFYTAISEGLKTAVGSLMKIPEETAIALGMPGLAEKLKTGRLALTDGLDRLIEGLATSSVMLETAFNNIGTFLTRWAKEREADELQRLTKHHQIAKIELDEAADNAKRATTERQESEKIYEETKERGGSADSIAEADKDRDFAQMREKTAQTILEKAIIKEYDRREKLNERKFLFGEFEKFLYRGGRFWYDKAVNSGLTIDPRTFASPLGWSLGKIIRGLGDAAATSNDAAKARLHVPGIELKSREEQAASTFPRSGHEMPPIMESEKDGRQMRPTAPAPAPSVRVPSQKSAQPALFQEAISKASLAAFREQEGVFWAYPHPDPKTATDPFSYGIGYGHHLGAHLNFKRGELIIPPFPGILEKMRRMTFPTGGYKDRAEAKKMDGQPQMRLEEAEALLRADLYQYWGQSKTLVGGSERWNAMSPSQRHAVLDLVYHGGHGLTRIPQPQRDQLIQMLKKGDWKGAATILKEIPSVPGLPGLLRRDEQRARDLQNTDQGRSNPYYVVPMASQLLQALSNHTGATLISTALTRDRRRRDIDAAAGGSASLPPIITNVSSVDNHSSHTTLTGPLDTRTKANSWIATNIDTYRYI